MIQAVLGVGLLYAVALVAVERIEPSPLLRKVLRRGLWLHVAGMLARRWVIGALYGGVADSEFYNTQARILLQAKREGIDPIFLGWAPQGKDSENLIRVLAFIYQFVGSNITAGFFVFTLFGWIGATFFYKAAVIAFPSIDRMRYAMLLFFMPTLIYWPSSLGKDAWMLMMLGLTTYGVALLGQRLGNPIGIACLVGGMYGAALIRGHLVAIAAVAFVAAQMWPRRGGGVVRTVITAAVAVAVLTFASKALNSTFGTGTNADGSSGNSISSVLARTTDQTAQGGSQFTPTPVTSPLMLPLGAITVLFRPLPVLDTHSVQQLVGALESMTLLVLTYKSRDRLKRAFRLFNREVHIRFAATYTLAFIIPFSYIANFGILARQRTQVLPLFFVLLSVASEQSADEVEVPNDSDATDASADDASTARTVKPRVPSHLRQPRFRGLQ